MSKVGISYIITVYNKAPTLEQVFNSLLKQEGDFEREYIFVDDSSSDNSLEIINRIAKEHDNVTVLTQANSGPSIAINHALKHASKKYICLVDGDDYIQPYCSKTLLELAETHKSVITRALVKVGYDKGQSEKFDDKLFIMEDSLSVAINSFPIAGGRSLILREAFIQAGGCDERIFIQDTSPTFRLSLYGKFVHINTEVATAILNDEIAHISFNKHQEKFDAALTCYLFLTENNIDIKYKRQALKRYLKRAYRHNRKTNKNYFPDKHFWRYVGTRLNFIKITEENFKRYFQESFEVFDLSKIRLTIDKNHLKELLTR